MPPLDKAPVGSLEYLAALAMAGRMRCLHTGTCHLARVFDPGVNAVPTMLVRNDTGYPKYIKVTPQPTPGGGVPTEGRVTFHTSGNQIVGEYVNLQLGNRFYEVILMPKDALYCRGAWGAIVPNYIDVAVEEYGEGG